MPETIVAPEPPLSESLLTVLVVVLPPVELPLIDPPLTEPAEPPPLVELY